MKILMISLLVMDFLRIRMPTLRGYIPRVESHFSEVANDYSVGVVNTGVERGWGLEIPSIGLNEEMDEVSIQGKTIPVPDNRPGVLVGKNGLFIVGHTPGVFSRLKEMPKEIIVEQDGRSRKYSLYSYEESRVENINMNNILAFEGAVIMTCSGEMVGGTMSHRLVLYYISKNT